MYALLFHVPGMTQNYPHVTLCITKNQKKKGRNYYENYGKWPDGQ